MSLQSQLTRMAQNVGALTADTNAIFEALRAKGVNVPANAQLSDVADMIESIVPPHQNEVEIGGRWYPYVQIGNQLWLAENLDYKFSYNGSTLPIGLNNLPSTPAAWYYNNDEAAYGIDGTYKCGLLYNWYAAKYLDDNKDTLLPGEWHVPTSNELDTLATNVGGTSIGGTKLKSLDNSVIQGFPSNWNGTNDYEFNAIPSGAKGEQFNNLGSRLNLWTLTEAQQDSALRYYLKPDSGIYYYVDSGIGDDKSVGYSLRLVRTIS